MKYQISPEFQFIASDDVQEKQIETHWDKQVLSQIMNKEVFILGNLEEAKYYLLNPSTKSFLELFQTPNTFKSCLKQFSQLAACSPDEALPIVKRFFDDMKHRDILVANNKSNGVPQHQIITELSALTEFLHFKIVKCLRAVPSQYTYIYIAQNEQTDERVLLKRLFFEKELTHKEKKYWTELFFQEFELMQEIGTHKHICEVKEVNTEGGYAVLEYIDGKGLREFIQTQELNTAEKVCIISQVIEAIAFVHYKRILHGDIHASNFLIQSDLTVKLIDFDLANRENPLEHEWVNEGGVFEYIPPEKINRNSFEIIKARSDYRSEVYQLGVILYIILYKKLPFNTLTWHELTDKILNSEPDWSNDSFTPDSDMIVFLKKCLDKNPLCRFENASDMLLEWNKIMNY